MTDMLLSYDVNDIVVDLFYFFVILTVKNKKRMYNVRCFKNKKYG